MLSASDNPAVSSGAVIGFPPVRMFSVLAFRQADNKPVERLGHGDLAGQARIGLRQRREAQHAGLLRARWRRTSGAKPGFIDIDMTGGAGALAAAIGVDTGDVVVDGAAHDRTPDRHLDKVLAPAMFDVGDFRHSAAILYFRANPAAQ